MRFYQVLAISWSIFNIWLTTKVPVKSELPWIPVITLNILPLVFFFFAEKISESFFKGSPFKVSPLFAKSKNEAQNPIIIISFGWFWLALYTIFLFVMLAETK